MHVPSKYKVANVTVFLCLVFPLSASYHRVSIEMFVGLVRQLTNSAVVCVPE